MNLDNLRVLVLAGTSSATINTQTSHAHGLVGAVIVYVQIQEHTTASAARIYLTGQGYPLGWDNTNIYVKPAAAVATQFVAFVWYYGGQA